MNLIIHIETIDEDFALDVGGKDGFQMRSDGILVNGKLFFWEQILTLTLFNREAVEELKNKGK